MKTKFYKSTIDRISILFLLIVVTLTSSAQNAIVSTPMGIGKRCGGSATTDSFRVVSYNNTSNSLTVGFKCKPVLGGGTPAGPAFSSSSGSCAFNPKDQKVYYIATTTGNNSFVYSWTPNFCPSTTQVYNYYYSGQFVVGLDFDPNSSAGDGYQLEFTGSAAPYNCFLRKVNFTTSTFGASVPITLSAGKKIYQQRGDIIFTPQGNLYFAFDDKLFKVDYSNYAGGVVNAAYIDTLAFPSGYHLTGISYANGKFIGSTQNSGTGCVFKRIDISTGSAVITDITLTNGNFTAIDMATLINGIGVAKRVSSVAYLGSSQWQCQYDIKIKNFGNSILNNVQLVEDLGSVYGALLTGANVSAVGTLPTGLTLNPSFNGTTNTNIFAGGPTSILKTSPADSATVRVTFFLTTSNTYTTFYSSSIGSGTDNLFGTTVSDSSNNDLGLRSDLDFNGVPDDWNEDIKTPLRLIDWGVPLSNNIIDFNGNYYNGKVNLHWSMQNTEHGLIANIQRSSDGKNFQTIATMPIKQSSSLENYQSVDNLPLDNVNIYRIEFKRQDGSIFYSSLLPISVKSVKERELSVSPNPFKDRVYFSVDLDRSEKVKYQLLDMNSRVIANGEKAGQIGTNKFTIDNLSNIPAGTYLLRTYIGDKNYQKVIIKTP